MTEIIKLCINGRSRGGFVWTLLSKPPFRLNYFFFMGIFQNNEIKPVNQPPSIDTSDPPPPFPEILDPPLGIKQVSNSFSLNLEEWNLYTKGHYKQTLLYFYLWMQFIFEITNKLFWNVMNLSKAIRFCFPSKRKFWLLTTGGFAIQYWLSFKLLIILLHLSWEQFVPI